MKKLILITLLFGLFSYTYAGCGGCGSNHDHDHSKAKACDTCECSKDCSKDRADCDKKEKPSCGACPVSEKKSSCGSSK